MNIYVSNLSRNVTEDELKIVFQQFGQVDSVKIIKDWVVHVSKGFGYVEMPIKSEAEQAITSLQGEDFRGKPIEVEETLCVCLRRTTNGRFWKNEPSVLGTEDRAYQIPS